MVTGTPRAVALTSGNILVAWPKSDGSGVGYDLFNQNGIPVLSNPGELAAINQSSLDNISIASDTSGRGIITWTDQHNYDLYYALVGNTPTGFTSITPTLSFYRGENSTVPSIKMSSTGRGVAPLDYFATLNLPLVVR